MIDGAQSLVLEAGVTSFLEPGFSAVDIVDGDLTSFVVVNSALRESGTELVGDFTITYTVVDSSNNAATATRQVTVADTRGPIVLVNGDQAVTLEGGASYIDEGATANDAAEGSVSVTATGLEEVDSSADLNTVFTITYTAEVGLRNVLPVTNKLQDSLGQVGTATRTVRVVDTLAPVVTLEGDASIEIAVGSTFEDPGATALDQYLGTTEVTTLIVDLESGQAVSSISTEIAGSYEIRYSSSDSNGNTGSVVRQVTVDDPCAEGPCQNGGTCSVVDGEATCACVLGFEGSNCETNIDDCVNFSCRVCMVRASSSYVRCRMVAHAKTVSTRQLATVLSDSVAISAKKISLLALPLEARHCAGMEVGLSICPSCVLMAVCSCL